jgi:hypothetical protein
MKSSEFLNEANMSRTAKGHEKYGKEGMEALAKAGREGASEKKLDAIRDQHDKYNESVSEEKQKGVDGKVCWDGYKRMGTKKKGGKTVDNCVKMEESNDEYDDEAGMVDSNLETIKRAAEELDQVLGQDDNMAEWAQEKLAVVKSMLVAVKDYVVSQKSTGIDPQVDEEFDMIESIIESLAERNQVDAEVIWGDLESLTEDELYVFAVTSTLNEDWQKVNKRDKTDGMSKKAVASYRRENPGSKLKTAVTTKPSKLKRGSKASKRRKSYCSRSKGQMNMHNISCAKTPDKAICKARRRWNC